MAQRKPTPAQPSVPDTKQYRCSTCGTYVKGFGNLLSHRTTCTPALSMDAYIAAHRQELDAAIQARVTLERPLTDKDIRLWIVNDAALWEQARQAGVTLY